MALLFLVELTASQKLLPGRYLHLNRRNPEGSLMACLKTGKKFVCCMCVTVVAFLLPFSLAAQTNCEAGNSRLNTAEPTSITSQQIIQKFATEEGVFKDARNHYTYTQEVIVQTLQDDRVDGEMRETTDVLYDDQGRRIEQVTYAPQNTLTRIIITKEDYDDFRNRLPFVLTTQDLGQYTILYAGQQRVDELDTYVFDIAPKKVDKDGKQRFFQGRIWVDNHDFQIVKTCGKNVPDIHKKNEENLTPKFVTYREQVDGQYWFPTYTRADDTLHFKDNDVRVREIVKYMNYKRFGVKSKIILGGEVKDGSEPK
jgi:hypothetical protein